MTETSSLSRMARDLANFNVFCISAAALFNLALDVESPKKGWAMLARMAIIAMTTMTSSKEYPAFLNIILISRSFT